MSPQPRPLLALALLCASVIPAVQAQVAPRISITPAQLPTLPLARDVTVQPTQLEARLTPGQVTASLNFTLLSPVTTEVRLRSEDSRLVIRQPDVPIRLTAFNTQPVSVLVLAAHSGVVSVINREGTVITRIPYQVEPPKLTNKNLSLNYSPSSERLGLSFALSSNPQSIFDPRWSVSTNVSLKTDTGQVSGGVNVNMSW